MGVPYTRQTLAAVPAAANTLIVLNVPPRGTLVRLTVVQTAGTAQGFTVDLYDRKDAVPGQSAQTDLQYPRDPDRNPTSDTPLADYTALVNTALHKLTDTLSAVAGESIVQAFDITIPYVNQDERDYSGTPTGALYLNIVPLVATTNKTFVASWTAVSADLR